MSAGDGAASRAFRRFAAGDRDRCGPRLWPPAPWESGRWRDEAQQGRRGTVHRFGAGFRPVAPRGELVLETRVASALALPRPRAAPASWLPAAAAPWRVEAPAGSRCRVGGVALASSRGGGRPRRAAVGASSSSSSWPPTEGTLFAGPSRPGVPRLRPCGLVTGAPEPAVYGGSLLGSWTVSRRGGSGTSRFWRSMEPSGGLTQLRGGLLLR